MVIYIVVLMIAAPLDFQIFWLLKHLEHFLSFSSYQYSSLSSVDIQYGFLTNKPIRKYGRKPRISQ
jgi:hypothetical protein